MNSYYTRYLKKYSYGRVSCLEDQIRGVDLVLRHKAFGKEYLVDEKAQLDYINECLPTFAFELCYEKNGVRKKGWLFDSSKSTHFYALVTSIFSDEAGVFTSCTITFVNRKKLIHHLKGLNLTEHHLDKLVREHKNHDGKKVLEVLCSKKEGYLFFSTQNKAEKPVNLILKLDYLIQKGIAKRLV